MKLHTKCQSPGPSSFTQEDFVPICVYVKEDHVTLWGYSLNNLGKCLLDEAIYQISEAWAFQFHTRRFLFFPYMDCVKEVSP